MKLYIGEPEPSKEEKVISVWVREHSPGLLQIRLCINDEQAYTVMEIRGDGLLTTHPWNVPPDITVK